MHKRPIPIALAAVALVAAAGCAGLTEDQRDARDMRNFDYENRFRTARRVCRARGGRLVISAHERVGRDGIPRRGAAYFCS